MNKATLWFCIWSPDEPRPHVKGQIQLTVLRTQKSLRSVRLSPVDLTRIRLEQFWVDFRCRINSHRIQDQRRVHLVSLFLTRFLQQNVRIRHVPDQSNTDDLDRQSRSQKVGLRGESEHNGSGFHMTEDECSECDQRVTKGPEQ